MVKNSKKFSQLKNLYPCQNFGRDFFWRKMIFKFHVEYFSNKFFGDDILELNSAEQAIINQTYGRQFGGNLGYGSNQIEKVVELTPKEARFFTQKHFISPYFAVQTLYKIRGNVTIMKFSVATI